MCTSHSSLGGTAAGSVVFGHFVFSPFSEVIFTTVVALAWISLSFAMYSISGVGKLWVRYVGSLVYACFQYLYEYGYVFPTLAVLEVLLA